jgi:threonine synthase
VRAHEKIVLILTGHVLKDPDFTIKFHRGELFKDSAHEQESAVLKSQQRAPIVLDPEVRALVKILEDAEKTG